MSVVCNCSLVRHIWRFMFFPDVNVSSARMNHVKLPLKHFSNKILLLFLSIFVLRSFKKLRNIGVERREERDISVPVYLMCFPVVNPAK